jgi:hypothetical protein
MDLDSDSSVSFKSGSDTGSETESADSSASGGDSREDFINDLQNPRIDYVLQNDRMSGTLSFLLSHRRKQKTKHNTACLVDSRTSSKASPGLLTHTRLCGKCQM